MLRFITTVAWMIIVLLVADFFAFIIKHVTILWVKFVKFSVKKIAGLMYRPAKPAAING